MVEGLAFGDPDAPWRVHFSQAGGRLGGRIFPCRHRQGGIGFSSRRLQHRQAALARARPISRAAQLGHLRKPHPPAVHSVPHSSRPLTLPNSWDYRTLPRRFLSVCGREGPFVGDSAGKRKGRRDLATRGHAGKRWSFVSLSGRTVQCRITSHARGCL